MSLKAILTGIQKKLCEKEKIREEIQRDMRKATRLSKQAIQVTHQERFDEAKAMLKEAKSLFVRFQEMTENTQHPLHSGSASAAYEEYAEAHILLTLVQEERFPTPNEIGVPAIPYVLSLGDVIGELRRRALDSIRKGDVPEAEKCLESMEHIYNELTALDDAYIIVKGLRRKGDVARSLIEITRGDLTMEVRRNALEKSFSKLQKAVKKGSQGKKD